MISEAGILYIEPQLLPSLEPVVDSLTRRMAAAYHRAAVADTWHGSHTCCCGVSSTAADYQLQTGERTNSLCVHYLAWHRGEVPESQLAKVRALPAEEIEPPLEVLEPPPAARSQWPRAVISRAQGRNPWEITFAGTDVRVVSTVAEWRVAGRDMESFLLSYPDVERWQAEAVWQLPLGEVLAGCQNLPCESHAARPGRVVRMQHP